MTTPKSSRISRVNFTLYKIPLKMNAEESIFSNATGLHLQILLINNLLQRHLLKTTISRTFVSSNSHSVVTKNRIYKRWLLLSDYHSPNPLVLFVEKIKYLKNSFQFLFSNSRKYNLDVVFPLITHSGIQENNVFIVSDDFIGRYKTLKHLLRINLFFSFVITDVLAIRFTSDQSNEK